MKVLFGLMMMMMMVSPHAMAADEIVCGGFQGADENTAYFNSALTTVEYFDNISFSSLSLVESKTLKGITYLIYEGSDKSFGLGSLRLTFNQTRMHATLYSRNHSQDHWTKIGMADCSK